MIKKKILPGSILAYSSCILFLLLFLLLLLSGCARQGQETQAGWIDLSADELAWFNEQFFNDPENKIPNSFLNCEYSSAAEIDLYELFYDYTSDESGLSDQERFLLKELGVDVDLDIAKISADDVEKVLLEYAGLTLQETQRVSVDKLTYLSEYDAYYLARGDSHFTYYTMEKGMKREDGIVKLQYAGGEVILSAQEAEYHFISNATRQGDF